MVKDRGDRGVTFGAVAVLIVLGVGFFAVVLPAVVERREDARRAICQSNMKRLGWAFHSFLDLHQRFPPSCHVDETEGKIAALDGWSWEVDLLPFVDQEDLWRTLDIHRGKPLDAAGVSSGRDSRSALAIVLPSFVCPSFSGSAYADPETKRQAITNYKGIGATHIESLSMASPAPSVPKYPSSSSHPDGVVFPGKGMGLSDISDGTSNTLLAAETIEPKFARWTVGAEASLVGLPRDVVYEEVPMAHFYAPRGYTLGKVGDDSTVDRNFRTYLSWDFARRPYEGGSVSPGNYGPSSMHPGVVNHLFCDGGVRAISMDVDVALYMFIITRRAGDAYP